MIPSLKDKPTYNKYFLLEDGDIMKLGDEYFNPVEDKWELISDGEPDQDGNYLDAFIGYPFNNEESKPVRRRNKKFSQKAYEQFLKIKSR